MTTIFSKARLTGIRENWKSGEIVFTFAVKKGDANREKADGLERYLDAKTYDLGIQIGSAQMELPLDGKSEEDSDAPQD